MKIIQLTQGYTTVIDDTDYESVKRFKWCAVKNRNKIYAYSDKLGMLHKFLMNPPLGKVVDHKNGNGLDNLRSNLRLATNGQNIANSALRKDNTSGYKGVTWFKGSKHPNGAWKRKPGWSVRVSLNGKRVQVGYYQDKKDAALAYNEAALKHHGEYARPNVI